LTHYLSAITLVGILKNILKKNNKKNNKKIFFLFLNKNRLILHFKKLSILTI